MKAAWRPFFRVLMFYAALVGGRFLFTYWISLNAGADLEAEQREYYHYQSVRLVLKTRNWNLLNEWRRDPPRVFVTRKNRPVTTIGGLKQIELRWDGSEKAWSGEWPCPWNAPEDVYTPVLVGADRLKDFLKNPLRVRPFRILYRKPRSLPSKFVVLTLETNNPLSEMKIQGPDGTVRDWTGALDWAQYLGADALWVLGGESPGDRGEIWLSYNFPMLPKLARECHKRGLKFGVWAMSYLTMPRSSRIPRYEYAVDVDSGALKPTRSISLSDPNRPQDLAELLKRFRDIPEVDYLGLDYIRNALGGYELAGDFLKEMPWVRPPAGWDHMSKQERMVAFARKKIARRDRDFIDAWEWWRAHRVGEIVSQIKREVGDEKPLWAFTLGWEKGWQHGQDPVMMNDAGVDIVAVMMYEATPGQFNDMIAAWHRYLRSGQAQVIVGDVVDWPLHQDMGLEEFARRLRAGIGGIYRDGPADGMFIHDLGRALWGRKGPYTTRQWMDAAKGVVGEFRSPSGISPQDVQGAVFSSTGALKGIFSQTLNGQASPAKMP